MKVLIFGRNGQVGSQLSRVFVEQPRYDVITASSSDQDLRKTEEIIPFIIRLSPNWVINASAYTAVDKAESEVETCFKLNSDAPEMMSKACKEIGANMVHYSTDYVFDGRGEQPYLETDPTHPVSVYGRSKLEGEERVLEQLPSTIIFRTAWVYAKKGHNFVNTMLRLATEREALSVVSDQYGCPTLADDLAQVTVDIIAGITGGNFPHRGGVFHATGQGKTNWYDFCRQIMQESNNQHTKVNPILTSAYPTPAPRPGYSVLSNEKLLSVYGQQLPDWKSSLRNCLKSIR